MNKKIVNIWFAKLLVVSFVVAVLAGGIARILGRVFNLETDYFLFLLPMIMGWFIPISYNAGVKYVVKKEGLEPVSYGRIKKNVNIRRSICHQIIHALILISLSMGLFFCRPLFCRIPYDLYLGGVKWLFFFWGILILSSLSSSYKAGIEDMQKVIAERQDSQKNVV